MKKIRKWLSSMLVVSMLGLVSMGCGGSTQTQGTTPSTSGEQTTENKKEEPKKEGKPVELRFATNQTEQTALPVISAVFDQYMKENPHVKIKVEQAPNYDLQTKIQLDATSGRLPDFFQYWRPDPAYGLDKMIAAGLIADLTEFANQPDIKGLFDETAWNTATVDGKVRGIPLLMFYIHILANKEVFESAGVKIPETWDEMLTAMDQLKGKGIIPWGATIKGDHGVRLFDYVFSAHLTNDRALNMFAGKEPIDIPEVVAAAKDLQKLVVGNIPEDSIAIEYDALYAKYINTGKAALVIDGSFRTSSIDKAMEDKFQVIHFPIIPGGAQTETRIEKDLTTLFYSSAKAWDDPDKRPHVEELLKRLVSRESAKKYAEDQKQPIPTLGVEIDGSKLGPIASEAQALALSVKGNVWIPKVMQPEKRKKWEPMLAEFLNGKYTPEEFVKKMHDIFYEG
ncbi:ABC transporter substrate-binding protein [Ammoniphilus sp. YIM 78166]|uniref:ABC transporter substrate-binding protein n=1 Tax=Ammoniphilus sp. YIM 78166 TaxID=1644106 RepID=UPI00106FED3F|nr:extracellular solute-binding protein [Ammoniphilus sp. YIM 78166]